MIWRIKTNLITGNKWIFRQTNWPKHTFGNHFTKKIQYQEFPIYPAISITIWEKEIPIHSQTTRTLQNIISDQRSLRYLSTHHWPVHDTRADLEVLQHAERNTASWNKRWLSKWQCEMQGIGDFLQRWMKQNHPRCPRCQMENKTVQHVLQCRHADAVNLWTTGVEDIEKWMRKNSSISGLPKILRRRLGAWQQGAQPPCKEIHEPRIHHIINAMDSLGWNNFCFGIVPKCWTQYQSNHLQQLHKKLPGTTWMSRLVRQVWDLQKKMWVHCNYFFPLYTKKQDQYMKRNLLQLMKR